MTVRQLVLTERVLLVEGDDDKLVFETLAGALGITGLTVVDLGGNRGLTTELRTLRTIPGFDAVRALGIVRDADLDATATLKSIQSSLRGAGFSVPSTAMTPTGTNPQVIVMVVPDGASQGKLEDVCLDALTQAADPAGPCLELYVTCWERSLARPPRDTAKAKVLAALATREEHVTRVGHAVARGIWPVDGPAFDSFRRLLRAL